MKKVFDFGKIDFNNTGRRVNRVAITIELKYKDTENKKPCFTAMAMIWNKNHTDIVAGGQCLTDLFDHLKNNSVFCEILYLWRLYHLNDTNAGTKEQKKALDMYFVGDNKYNYDKACEYLKSINLYEVEHEGKPYKYGHGWIYYEIPEKDLNRINHLFELSEEQIKEGIL